MKHSHKLGRRLARGFTLMEMMLVLGIIALLVGLGIYSMQNVGVQAEMQTCMANLKALETNLVRYKALAGSLPTQSQGLEALVTRPSGAPQPKSWIQFTTEDGVKDPWGEPFQYRIPGRKKSGGYDLFSKGPDKTEGTQDDIYN